MPLAESMKHKSQFRPNPFKPVIRQELAVLIVRLRQSGFPRLLFSKGNGGMKPYPKGSVTKRRDSFKWPVGTGFHKLYNNGRTFGRTLNENIV